MRGQSPICIACRLREKTPEMSACDAMMVASAANPTRGNQGPVRRQFVKRTIDRVRIGKNQRPLTEVVQQQRGQDQAEPGAADRRGPDMTHVGVKRLRAGQREENAAHYREGDDRVRGDETGRLDRTERFQDFRRGPDVDESRANR